MQYYLSPAPTSNTSFTNLPKPLAEVTADLDDFDAKIAAALSGG